MLLDMKLCNATLQFFHVINGQEILCGGDLLNYNWKTSSVVTKQPIKSFFLSYVICIKLHLHTFILHPFMYRNLLMAYFKMHASFRADTNMANIKDTLL